MNGRHDLDALLMKRVTPSAPHDLADRIIHRAVRMPQTIAPLTIRDIISECLSYLVIPQPALAFGLCLMLGLFSGWMTTAQNTDTGTGDTTQVLDMVVIEEEWL